MNASLTLLGSEDVRAKWPEPDLTDRSESERADYLLRKAALIALLDGASPSTVAEQSGLARSVLSRMVARSISTQQDGHAIGFFACLKYYRAKSAVRKSPVDESLRLRHKGLACAFRYVVSASKDLSDFVDDLVVSGAWSPRAARKKVFTKFCRLAQVAGLGPASYPFDMADGGWRSFFRYLKTRSNERADNVSCIEQSANRAPMAGDNSGLPSAAALRRIYDEVEFDGWLEPVDMEVLISSRHGIDVPVRIEGIGLLAVLERKSTTVLGYLPLFKTSYDSLDVITCFYNALSKWSPRQLTVPTYAYKPGAALPSGVADDAVGRLWNCIFADNLRVHIGELATKALLEKVCCHSNFGRAGEPTARPIVERFFKYVTDLGLRSLLGRRSRQPSGRGRFIDGAIPMPWVEDIFDVICTNYNVEKKSTLMQMAPLDLILTELRREDGGGRSDPGESASWRKMMWHDVVLDIKRPSGRTPYVLFEHAQYASPTLKSIVKESPSVRKLKCSVFLKDVRDLHARTLDGIDIGILNAKPPFAGATPCDIQTRRLVAKAMKREGPPLTYDVADAHAVFAANQLVKGASSRQAGSVVATMASRGTLPDAKGPAKAVVRAPRGGWIDIEKV